MDDLPGSLPGLNWETDIFPNERFDSGGRGPYHAPAMGNPLQERRAPQELAAIGQVIEITSKVGDFEQLSEIVAADLSALDPDKLPPDWRNTVVAGRLSFGFQAAQSTVPVLTGQVIATIFAVCQRCLQAFALPLAADLQLQFGEDEGLEGFEVWELDDKDVCPADLVEEALIMTIPFVTMHADDATCQAQDASDNEAEKMTLPFANLKAQMKRKN